MSAFDVYGECVSHLSMSQRAGPGPIYYVSWPKGSRLGLNNQTENIFLVKNDVFGSEITQINKFDQFLEVLENSRLSLNPLVPWEFSKFRRNQKVKVKLQNDLLAAKMAVESQILDML